MEIGNVSSLHVVYKMASTPAFPGGLVWLSFEPDNLMSHPHSLHVHVCVWVCFLGFWLRLGVVKTQWTQFNPYLKEQKSRYSRVFHTPRRAMQMQFLSFPKENLLYFHIWMKKKNPTKTGKWKQKHLDFGVAGTSFQLNNCQQHLQLPALNRCSRNTIIFRRMCWVEGVEWVMLGCDLLIKVPTDTCV